MAESSYTILLVDDDESTLKLTKILLQSEGFRVLVARHSDEALVFVNDFTERIDMLITDVVMDPFMNGFELAKCIRLLRPGIRILYISGFHENPMVLQEVQGGRASFVGKPFTIHDLLKPIHLSLKTQTQTESPN